MTPGSESALPSAERRHFPRRWRRARRALIGLVVLIGLALLGNLAWQRVGGPRLYAVVPAEARIGDAVTLEGRGFGGALEDNVVYFGGMTGRVLRASSDELIVEVPEMELGPDGRLPVRVKVQVGEEESSDLSFVVRPPLQPEPGTEPLAGEELDDEPDTPGPP